MTSTCRPRSHRDLAVWRDAVALAERVGRVAGTLPAAERFGLGGRLRREAGAVAVRIAAGHGCGHRGSHLDHLSGALGSLARLQLELIVAARQRYLGAGEADQLELECGRVRRSLGCLVASLHARPGATEGASAWRSSRAGADPVASDGQDRRT